ncbi:MAG: adenylosuccinate lyase [Phycisphaerae bacterium]
MGNSAGAAKQSAYQSPLVGRYASPAMIERFGALHRTRTWRELWIALATCQKELDLPITTAQIDQLRSTADQIDFDVVAQYEKSLRHDVMAHVHAWGDLAPDAKGILHLGATSAFIVDNADLIIMREALHAVAAALANVVVSLSEFAERHRDLPTLGFTHFQPAQVTTVGKRATLWCYDFLRDLEEIEHRIANLRFRGVKGTTGTQASFLTLFDGDHEKVRKLDRALADHFAFGETEPVTGQTYSRKVDAQVAASLAGIAASAHKFSNDLRLLANLKEMEEPFEKNQIGSSAMAYKRNPMRCERITGLARFVLSVAQSPLQTHAEQWLERSLDDSANKRLSMPESFLATDAILGITHNVTSGMVVYPKVIQANMDRELPFMATENIMMAAAALGGDRQVLHERIRQHSMDAAREVKEHGRPNDLIARLKKDEAFKAVDFDHELNASRFVGRSPEQVLEFTKEHVAPIRDRYAAQLTQAGELNV